ncbi:MAG: 50S ribosomal protein L21 [Gammaproteobacteria bacterium]|nr:50S ribosomal protein L21 [Gammaproteobacteria bacterium]MCY4210345.1 50S ribosomal protein L21 [Gammaproteobacteria bacterium]MCY4282782.1 50S ribosomal protein L21 [Gammaproteobacteria bacterium]MCY4339173.1 50S ribosomal protein L21 [Gammaproteobacteria bacterium]
MYAVIKTGGKQYKVQEGDTLRVEKLDVEEGAELSLDEVLMVADGENISVGTPTVAGAAVAANVQAHGRGEKIKVVKFKRRKHHHKQMGHRQSYTELKITGITQH